LFNDVRTASSMNRLGGPPVIAKGEANQAIWILEVVGPRSWPPRTDGGLPLLDVARIQRWCDQQVPDHIRNEIRIECTVTPHI
jgi:hypothetical protein